MSEAFRCDGCGEYHDGAPTTRLGEYKSWVMKESGYEKVAELCRDCSDEFFTRFTLDDADDPPPLLEGDDK
jgi:hypothetical protein